MPARPPTCCATESWSGAPDSTFACARERCVGSLVDKHIIGNADDSQLQLYRPMQQDVPSSTPWHVPTQTL
eukprot:3254359-Pleurochrysis_carterae.AAC.1